MTLTIHITREVNGPYTYSATKPETVVYVKDTNLGSEALTAKYLRALADEIDPPKASYATGGIIPAGTLR